MKAMKQIVVAVSIVVIFAMAPIVSAQPVICRYAAAKGLGDFASKAAFSSCCSENNAPLVCSKWAK